MGYRSFMLCWQTNGAAGRISTQISTETSLVFNMYHMFVGTLSHFTYLSEHCWGYYLDGIRKKEKKKDKAANRW